MTDKDTTIKGCEPVPEKAGSPLEYISASRLKSFLECRFRFYLEKVLGMKSPVTANLHIGRSVHAGLQEHHLALWRGEPHDADALLEAYRNAYTQGEKEEPIQYDKKDREECIDTGQRVLSAYIDSDVAKDTRRILGVEAWLRADSCGTSIPLVGVLDLVRDEGAPVAIDFKTVASTPDMRDEAWQNQLQMVAYHLLLRDAVGEDPAGAELIYLVKLKTPKVLVQRLSIDQQQIDRFRSLVDVYVDAVEHHAYHPSPGMHCRWCSWHGECQAFAGMPEQCKAAA